MYICWYINCQLYVFFNIKYEYNITLTVSVKQRHKTKTQNKDTKQRHKTKQCMKRYPNCSSESVQVSQQQRHGDVN